MNLLYLNADMIELSFYATIPRCHLSLLARYKAEASKEPGSKIPLPAPFEEYVIRSYGAQKYKYILDGPAYKLMVSDTVSDSFPSIRVVIGSYSLALGGISSFVSSVTSLFSFLRIMVRKSTVSRLDVCADVDVPISSFPLTDDSHIVCRGRWDIVHYRRGSQLTGVQVGRGSKVCRIYDKVLELGDSAHQAKTDLFYQHWSSFGDVYSVTRVEFQLRREALVKLGVSALEDLTDDSILGLFRHCCTEWMVVSKTVVDRVNKNQSRARKSPADAWAFLQSSTASGVLPEFDVFRQRDALPQRQALKYATTMLFNSMVKSQIYSPRQYNSFMRDLIRTFGDFVREQIDDNDSVYRVKYNQIRKNLPF